MINIDFETKSRCDLITEGVYNYAADPSTDIICMWYSIDGAEPAGWHPGDPVPECFLGAHDYAAWNATFERLIWEFIMEPQYGFPGVPLERWRCTAFKARCNNMPNALGNAARCLSVPQQKQARGRELIKLMCVPQADGTFYSTPELMEEMDQYCAQDVKAEQAVGAQLREPTATEWEDYYANERINDRGFVVDTDLCKMAQVYAAEEEADLINHIEQVTQGEVTKARGENLKAWVCARLTQEQERLLVKYRDGERKLSLDKYNRARLLALDDLDPDVAEVVEASDFAQKSSVGKFRAMQRLADVEDSRVRGAIMCNGAPASGRFSSKGAQIHNFPRECMDNPAEVRADFLDQIMSEDITDYFGAPMMTILSRMLRPAIIPGSGCVFLDSDWAAIEGRVAPWLCDNWLGEQKLDLYRNGEDTYKIAAAGIYRTAPEDIDKDQRQIGKVAELSLQYGGGENAFLGMARGYGVVVPKAQAASIKEGWRSHNQWAVKGWRDVEGGARAALANPGKMLQVGRLTYFSVEDVLCGGRTLFCQLPCGRLLTYPDTRIEMRVAPWGDEVPTLTYLRSAFTPKVDEKEWPRTTLWGGLLFENAVQGTAASLLRWAVREAQSYGLAVVFHVHDQIVCEAKKEYADRERGYLMEIMNQVPDWATGLPVEAEVDVVERFGK